MARRRRSSSSKARLGPAAAAAALLLLAGLVAPPPAAAAAPAPPRAPLRVLAVGDSLSQGSVPSLWVNHPYTIEMGRRLEAIFRKQEEMTGKPKAGAKAAAAADAPVVVVVAATPAAPLLASFTQTDLEADDMSGGGMFAASFNTGPETSTNMTAAAALAKESSRDATRSPPRRGRRADAAADNAAAIAAAGAAAAAIVDAGPAAAAPPAPSPLAGRRVESDPYSVIGGAGVFAVGPYERKQTLTDAALEALARGSNGTGQ
jgi:hypothetical protein